MRELLWMVVGRNEAVGEWISLSLGGKPRTKKTADKKITMEALCKGMGL